MGYFAIGIENPNYLENVGSLWRSAHIFGASYIFTIGKRFKKQKSDTTDTANNIPLFYFEKLDDFVKTLQPRRDILIGIEMHNKSIPIKQFTHYKNCIYLLGSEKYGLSEKAIMYCNQLVKLPGDISLNVAIAGSLIMFDRFIKIIE